MDQLIEALLKLVEPLMKLLMIAVQLAGWLLVFAVALIVAPPIIAIYTAIRRDKPFSKSFTRRCRFVLFQSLSSPPSMISPD
ncbi:MAG: hypothetical protein AAF078_05700 [Planctomycetota bacterium]